MLIADKKWELRPSNPTFLRFLLLVGAFSLTFLRFLLLRGNPRISSISSFAWNYSRFLLIPGKPRISCFSSFARNYRTFLAFLRLPGIAHLLDPTPPLPPALSARLGTYVSKWNKLQHRWRGEVIFEKIGGGGVLSAIFPFFSKK